MSEITINLPLDALRGAESLTPEGISKFLASSMTASARIEAAERNEKALAQTLIDWASALQNILDSDLNDFQRAQALRELIGSARQYTNFVKGKIQ